MTKLLLLTIATVLVTSCAPSVPLEDFESAQSEIESLTSELSNSKDALAKNENELKATESTLNESINALQSELDTMEDDFTFLQGAYDDLSNFTYCGEDILDLDTMNYRSAAKASDALTQWVDEMWGDVLDSSWNYFWSPDGPTLQVVETGYANDFFVVYFGQQDFFNAKDGVFLVSHHCWLDGGP